MKRRFIGFESTDQVDRAIKKERKRLAKGLPGSRVKCVPWPSNEDHGLEL